MRAAYRRAGMIIAFTGVALGSLAGTAQAQVEKRNMELVGYHDLQARSAYQPLVVE